MGLCCTSRVDRKEVDKKVLLSFLQKNTNLKTLWNRFKRNREKHKSLEVSEFNHMLSLAFEIFAEARRKHMQKNTSLISKASIDERVDLESFRLLQRFDTPSKLIALWGKRGV